MALTPETVGIAAGLAAGAWLLRKVQVRLRLSRAKHPSLRGHARMSRRLASIVPFYEYDDAEAFACDGAHEETVARRRKAFQCLSERLSAGKEKTRAASGALEHQVSDMQFTNANRVPFQFRRIVMDNLVPGAVNEATSGVKVCDLDGNWSYDLAGSYGVNLLG